MSETAQNPKKPVRFRCSSQPIGPLPSISASLSPFGWHRYDLGTIDSANSLCLTGDVLTFFAGFRLQQAGLGNTFPRVFDKSDGAGLVNGYGFYIDDGVGDDCRFDVNGSSYGSNTLTGNDKYRVPAAGLLPPAADQPGRHSIEAQQSRTIVLSVAAVLEILGGRIERHELVEQPIVGRELEHRPTCPVPTDDIAGFEQVVEQRAGLGARIGE